jgi:arabinan endo-1,5-alpha-L-arabinosidase
VHYRAPYYYLFFSGDNCCGPNAHYAALVARSRSATGPFEVREEPVVALRGNWIAPGHNAVATDSAGNDWIVYHAVDRRRPRSKADAEINSRRVMLIDRLVWEDGWPRIDGPSEGPRPSPAPLRDAATR